ncbi:MAG: gephyrin-like molybdotransferase Glp, partial [Pseudomonadota bacterium]
VLAADAVATRDQPPFDASAMDGYAVRAADLAPGARLLVAGTSAAGDRFAGVVPPRGAVRIYTGAPVPPGADRILIQEDCTRDGDHIAVADRWDSRAYIRPAAGDFAQGDLVTAPRVLGPADIALLAAMNVASVQVRARPQVALISTGDELVMPGENPGPDQIISSNGLGLAALLRRAGAEQRVLPIAGDTPAALHAAFDLSRGVDLIVTLGGASVGDRDLVRQVAADAGLDQAFYKVAMRPGKPLMAGRLGPVPLVGLPGNPVSALVCGHVFIVPAVRAMLGLPPLPPRSKAPLAVDLEPSGPREHYMRATRDGQGRVTPADRQDSSLLGVLAEADCLMVRPASDGHRRAGELVETWTI